MNEWIECSEMLPDDFTRCIVFAPDGDSQVKGLVVIAVYCGSKFMTGYYSNTVWGVTHWMHLPKPPI